MKISIIVTAIVAGVLSAPIVSAQDKHAHDKPAMSMDMDQSQMQESMKTIQHDQAMESIPAK